MSADVKRRVLIVAGARPQFIKAAPLFRSGSLLQDLQLSLLHAGQHDAPSMSDRFLEELALPPPLRRFSLSATTESSQLAEMLVKVEALLKEEPFDGVIVIGDTTATAAGALATSRVRLPLFHLEAGLRSGRPEMSEEQNRILCDQLAHLNFCPNRRAAEALYREGVDARRVFVTGDVLQEHVAAVAPGLPTPDRLLLGTLPPLTQRYVLATMHRAETVDDSSTLAACLGSLRELSSSVRVIFPVHPRTRRAIQLHGIDCSGLDVTDPLSYRDMLSLIKGADAVVTDSGGVQREAAWLGVRAVVLRRETEWPELSSAAHVLHAPGAPGLTECLHNLRPADKPTALPTPPPSIQVLQAVRTFLQSQRPR